MMSEPRAYTSKEMRDDFLGSLRMLCSYWASVGKDQSPKELCESLIQSVFCLVDGGSSGPSMDLVCRPHPDDKPAAIENDENWIEDGTVINAEDMLHELWYNTPRKLKVNDLGSE